MRQGGRVFDRVTITMEREAAKALLAVVPEDAMTYTPAGLRVFNAVQAIEHAVDPEKGEG